ncbi:unnamed protein product, partial [Ectocarpus sp. 13 AM-2016]
MLLQMILDSRDLMDSPDGITHRMGSLGGLGDPSRSTGPATSAAGKAGGGMNAEDCGAVFAQRIGVIFCALFNMFVDAEVLATVWDVAGRLAASAASPAEWASTELGSFVHFSDDRSQDRVHLREGKLDPFPLLREDTPAKRRGPCKLVNPLLLVTERKGAASTLHYGAFPLDAFNTGASLGKLRPQSFQDEYGRQAPTVSKPREMNSQLGGGGSRVTSIPTSVAQEAWLSAALEELAQMCGALLRATATSNADSSAGSRLSINVHVGDALNFCDTLLACESPVGGSADADGDTPKESATRGSPAAFQQDTLQPLHLRAGAVTDFDVISSSNLADYLGIINVVVVSAPLLKAHHHAVLLTSFISTLRSSNLFKGTQEFYEKLLCMNSHTAAVLL